MWLWTWKGRSEEDVAWRREIGGAVREWGGGRGGEQRGGRELWEEAVIETQAQVRPSPLLGQAIITSRFAASAILCDTLRQQVWVGGCVGPPWQSVVHRSRQQHQRVFDRKSIIIPSGGLGTHIHTHTHTHTHSHTHTHGGLVSSTVADERVARSHTRV